MKTANLIITIISSLVMLAADFLLFSISFLGSLVGIFVYNFSTANHDNIHATFGMLGLSLFIAVVAIVSLVLGIVAFVTSCKADAGARTYGILSGIVCGITLIANICAFPVTIWVNESVAGAEFYIAWPYIGFAILVPMAVLSIVAAVKMSKQQADVY